MLRLLFAGTAGGTETRDDIKVAGERTDAPSDGRMMLGVRRRSQNRKKAADVNDDATGKEKLQASDVCERGFVTDGQSQMFLAFGCCYGPACRQPQR